jgi:hypothetical protein
MDITTRLPEPEFAGSSTDPIFSGRVVAVPVSVELVVGERSVVVVAGSTSWPASLLISVLGGEPSAETRSTSEVLPERSSTKAARTTTVIPHRIRMPGERNINLRGYRTQLAGWQRLT